MGDKQCVEALILNVLYKNRRGRPLPKGPFIHAYSEELKEDPKSLTLNPSQRGNVTISLDKQYYLDTTEPVPGMTLIIPKEDIVWIEGVGWRAYRAWLLHPERVRS